MDFLIAVKSVVATASAASLIAMAFLAITPAIWFIAFTGLSLTWLFGEGAVKNTVSYIKNGGTVATTKDK